VPEHSAADNLNRELAGRVAVVPGPGPGIGRACALAFARSRADVVVAARRSEPLQALDDEVGGIAGYRTVAMPTDIGDLEQCAD
jgi:NAD(P)-dependent dehydrogenase (short-subunit alcohol dehydrogenase family)